MNQKDLISWCKAIPVLSAFAFSLLLFVCCFFVKETISAWPFLASYIDAGKSMFLPFVPRINLLFFLPEKARVLPFTFGHLLDFIILVNLSMVINPIAFPFWKKVSHEYQNNLYYDLHLENARLRLRPICVLLDVNRVILSDRQDLLDHSKEAGLKSASIRTWMKSRRSCDEEKEHGYSVGILARSRARYLELVHRQDMDTPITHPSFLYRFRESLAIRFFSTERFHVTRAAIALFSVSTPSFLMRYR